MGENHSEEDDNCDSDSDKDSDGEGSSEDDPHGDTSDDGDYDANDVGGEAQSEDLSSSSRDSCGSEEDCLLTERARLQQKVGPQIGRHGLMRSIVKFHDPVHLKVLALLPSNTARAGNNLINYKLVQQLNLTHEVERENCEVDRRICRVTIYGQLLLNFKVTDRDGVERSFDDIFLVADIAEDIVFGMDWLDSTKPVIDLIKKDFHWYRYDRRDHCELCQEVDEDPEDWRSRYAYCPISRGSRIV